MIPLKFEVIRCGCGEITGTPCAWDSPSTDVYEVEWMPLHLRASHEAAGNHGVYPSNGARRLLLAPSCARERVAADPAWTAILPDTPPRG